MATAAHTRSLRERVAAALANASPDAHEEFGDFARAATFTSSIFACTLIGVALLVTWPIDLVISAGNEARLAALTNWRSITIVIPFGTLFGLLVFVRSAERFRPWQLLGPMVLAAFISGYTGAQIGPLSEPWLFALMYMPAATILMLMPFPTRLALNITIAVASLGGILAFDLGNASHIAFQLLAIYLATQLLFTVAGGHFFQLLARELFRRSQEAKSQNRHLAELVEKRTQESLQAMTALDAAQERISQEIARDLHDELGHLIVVQGLELERFRREHAADSEMESRAGSLQHGLRSIEAAIRRTIAQLRTDHAADGRLSLAIASRLQAFGDDPQIETEAVVEPTDLTLPRAQVVAVTRIVQEALTNIRKHAGATRIAVSALGEDERVLVNIWDNGSGFDVDAKPGGYGLRGMRERAASVGATLHIQSGPTAGTEITVELPRAAP